jgi:[protein-PII] uridylyltransferase
MSANALFDAHAFETSLSASSNPVKLFRDTLRQAGQALQYRFLDGEQVASLVAHHARFIDDILIHAWHHSIGETAEEIALIAVGGYGRGELHPHSDIDIMILAEAEVLDSHGPALERFLMLLWDLGLEIGHSVRTVQDCIGSHDTENTTTPPSISNPTSRRGRAVCATSK